jgi:hypothetical protein
MEPLESLGLWGLLCSGGSWTLRALWALGGLYGALEALEGTLLALVALRVALRLWGLWVALQLWGSGALGQTTPGASYQHRQDPSV